MAGWRGAESGQNISEYAKLVCKEIGWPYTGNLTLLCDCISSLAHMKGLDAGGGFFILMEAVELAKRDGIRVDRWFFQDGRYVALIEELENAAKRIPPESDDSIRAGRGIPAYLRKPN